MHQFNNKQSRNSELKKGFILLDYYISYPPVERDEVYKEIFEQAENFKKKIIIYFKQLFCSKLNRMY